MGFSAFFLASYFIKFYKDDSELVDVSVMVAGWQGERWGVCGCVVVPCACVLKMMLRYRMSSWKLLHVTSMGSGVCGRVNMC